MECEDAKPYFGISGVSAASVNLGLHPSCDQLKLTLTIIPSSGTTALSLLVSNTFTKTMAGPAGGRDQTSNDPTGNFTASAASQFAPSYYPIDTELTNMSANYNLGSYARPMEETSSSVEKMDGNMNNMAVDTNGGAISSVVDPAMAPPQTPGQAAFPATASRASLDASSETPQDPQTGDKRKRSKASRACDECRRKKVWRHGTVFIIVLLMLTHLVGQV